MAPILSLLLRIQVVWVWDLFGNILGTPRVCVNIATVRWNIYKGLMRFWCYSSLFSECVMCVLWKDPCQSSMALFLIRLGILWLVMGSSQLVQILLPLSNTPESMPRTELGHTVSTVVFDRYHWVGIRNPLQISQWEGLLFVFKVRDRRTSICHSEQFFHLVPRKPKDTTALAQLWTLQRQHQLCDTCWPLALILMVSRGGGSTGRRAWGRQRVVLGGGHEEDRGSL